MRAPRRVLGVAAVSVLILALLGTRITRLDLHYEEARMARAQPLEVLYIPPPKALRVLSLGHSNFMADLLLMRANLYFVDRVFGSRILRWLDTYVETILALDPHNPRVYEWASQAVKFGQEITNEVLKKSNEYARRGIEQFPDHWRFYFDIGFNYHIEWRTDSRAEKERMREKALPYFSIAAALPGSEIDPNLVAELYAQEEQQKRALFTAYLKYWEASPDEQRALRGRITRYRSRAAAERLERAEERWKDELPYVPLGLYELLRGGDAWELPSSWSEVAGSRERSSGDGGEQG